MKMGEYLLGELDRPWGPKLDINCLPGDTEILTRDGFKLPIKEFENRKKTLVSFELNDHVPSQSEILLFFKRPERELIEIETESGKIIRASRDHPILTPNGMLEIEKIEKGDKVAVFHFDGVEFEEKNDVVVKEDDVPETVRKELVKRKLLPLTYSNEKIGIIARLFGYILGDGYIYLSKEKRRNRKYPRKRYIVGISSKSERDLQEISEDIKKLGFKASRVYTREKEVKIENDYGVFDVKSKENWIKISSNAFSSLLIALGMPIGDKTSSISIPKWIENAPKWIKRNFLAGFFGAELTKPSTIKNGITFSQPMLTIGIEKSKREIGIEFLKGVRKMLKEFGIKSNLIYEIKGTKKTIGLRLVISNKEENLEKLWSTIGYEYNLERKVLASLAVAYIRMKRRFKSKLKDRNNKIDFINFKKFVESCKNETKNTGFIFEKVIRKSIIPFNDFVYDFTVSHKDHNFVANNFVVHNCGVRVLRTNFTHEEIKPYLKQLVDEIFRAVPAGVGKGGVIKLASEKMHDVLKYGAKWAVENGYGWEEDLEYIEDNGNEEKLAQPEKVSKKAIDRGKDQLGTLGSGNHFLEIQVVDKIYLPEVAKALGIEQVGQVTVMVHCGSRGLGHQVATDYLQIMEREHKDWLRKLPDRQLAFAPSGTKTFYDYFGAMNAAANFAFANRQMITHWIRESFEKVFKKDAESLGLKLIYDITHNMAKLEEHEIDGKKMKVLVHRKGATRAYGPDWPGTPAKYRRYGLVSLIPGSMGDASHILIGTKKAEEESFASIAHGAGRRASRAKMLREFRGEEVARKLQQRGILVKAWSWKGVAEEAPEAYKPVDEVAEVCEKAGLAKRVVRLKPIAVIKGD
jgi:tRNA-splicing ligase RtcB